MEFIFGFILGVILGIVIMAAMTLAKEEGVNMINFYDAIIYDKGIIPISQLESRLWNYLNKHKRASYSEVCKEIYGEEIDDDYKRMIATNISRLNKKIKPIGVIITIRNWGLEYKTMDEIKKEKENKRILRR